MAAKGTIAVVCTWGSVAVAAGLGAASDDGQHGSAAAAGQPVVGLQSAAQLVDSRLVR